MCGGNSPGRRRRASSPALLQLQYAGVYALQRQWVTDRARAGWLALNVLAHDMPIDDQEEIRRLSRGPLNNYQNIGNTNRETSYFLRMYLGDCQALKYLASRPDWDGKTLVVMGDSMGGQQSFATVGLVGEQLKVTALIAHVPSGSDVGARSKGRSTLTPTGPIARKSSKPPATSTRPISRRESSARRWCRSACSTAPRRRRGSSRHSISSPDPGN